MPKYLFGPVTQEFAHSHLGPFIASGDCVTFDFDGPLALRECNSWESFSARYPVGWEPDFLVLSLQYSCLPDWLLHSGLPVVGLAADWNLQWHHYRSLASFCDHILTDPRGTECFRRENINHVSDACLFGCIPSWARDRGYQSNRDIDVLFVGNMHPFVQADRLPWLFRIGQLSNKFNVRICSGVFGDDYRRLLERSRIVFNRSIRDECNMRVFETLATGGLLFQEESNAEVMRFLTPGKEYVCYNEANVEERIEFYLQHESSRFEIAELGRARIRDFTYERFWAQHISLITSMWGQITARASSRIGARKAFSLQARIWQRQSAAFGSDTTLAASLRQFASPASSDSRAHYLLACVLHIEKKYHDAEDHFRLSFDFDPRNVIAGIAWAETLILLNRGTDAIAIAKRVLRVLANTAGLDIYLGDEPLSQPGYTQLRIAWEKAAYENSGNRAAEMTDKCALLRWRLLTLLGEVTGDVAYFYEAVDSRPELKHTHIALGRALRKQGIFQQAVEHLQIAAAAFPFDADLAADLYAVMGEASDTLGQQKFATERGRLKKAAAKLVRDESWLAQVTQRSKISVPGTRRLRIAWHGDQSTVHSLSIVNREICLRLIERGHELTLVEYHSHLSEWQSCPLPPDLRSRLNAPLSGPPEVHVCLRWPPVQTPPQEGHWVWIQPWEHGALPVTWQETVSQHLDEIWVPTSHVTQCFLKAGLPRDRVHLIPLGVSPVFFSSYTAFPLQTRKQFRFLFVGGTIHRKGFDLLLAAYGATFRRTDDVCLVVKDVGARTYYSLETSQTAIQEFRSDPDAPEIEYLDADLSTEQIAMLYSACHCLIHPYRAEGFGLPIAEAMATGLPVIVTGSGAALDFCNDKNSILVTSRIVHGQTHAVCNLETLGCPHWAEIDGDALRRSLRYAFENYVELSGRANIAATFIRENFTWEHAVDEVEERLQRLVEKEIRRPLRATQLSKVSHESQFLSKVAVSRPRISMCMIVRDNESIIDDCLSSIRPWVDEIVIVDTGSIDKTPEICLRHGAQLFHFPWCDDFSAARNESLRHATGDWIFWMDSDDVITTEQGQRLRSLVDGQHAPDCMGYVLQVHCQSDDSDRATVVDHVKLFRNHLGLSFEHRIHEQILPAIRRIGGNVKFADIHVIHQGSRQSAEQRSRKLERDFRILKLDNADHPDHPFVLFNLGMTCEDCGKYEEAELYLRRCLEVSGNQESHVRKAWALLINSLKAQGQLQQAIDASNVAVGQFPDDHELLFRRGILFQHVGRNQEAANDYYSILRVPQSRVFQSTDPSIRGYKVHHNLAITLEELGRTEEAIEHWEHVVALKPDLSTAWLALVKLLISLGYKERVDEILNRMPPYVLDSSNGATVRALVAVQHRMLSMAKKVLEEAWEKWHESDCLDELARILMENGETDDAIEVLRQLLNVRPDSPSVMHNLAQCLATNGEHDEAIALLGRSLERRPGARNSLALLYRLQSEK